MAAFQMYNAGLDRLQPWASSTYRFMLMQTGTFDITDATVANVLAGGTEITAVGYARDTATTTARTVDNTNNRIAYTCDDPDFGTLTAGQTVIALVCFLLVTNDADSVPVGWMDLPSTDTGAFDPFAVTLQDGTAFYTVDGNG